MNRIIKTDERIRRLVRAVGEEVVPRRGIMAELGLRQNSRRNFYANYLKPAVDKGYVCMALPGSPSSPEQAYKLTYNGLYYLKQIKEEEKSKKEQAKIPQVE